MNFDNYDLDPSIYDEMFRTDGTPRAHCRPLYETLNQLSAEELSSIQERVNRSFSNEGITFTVYGDNEADERIIPIDCLPRDNVERRLAATRGRSDPACQDSEPFPRRRVRGVPDYPRWRDSC